ncbi:MAG: hypothetical protein J5I57_01465 [Melioribacteraceae bacterium]|nr:hypothetical protein [Melioribacteraceae bacterium]
MKKYSNLIIILSAIVFYSNLFAHPTGNMIVIDKHVLWSYVNPINDPEHHACIMIWSEGKEPKPFITSEFEGSDYMLFNREDEIFIIERRFIQSSRKFEIRILKTRVGEQPKEIWPWFEDKWRIGEGGFFMKSDEEIVFASYPNILYLKKDSVPIYQFEFKETIKGIQLVSQNKLLLLGDNTTWLTDEKGNIIEQWEDLIVDSVINSPLNRNQIFDVDYQNGELLLAYWGNRSFDVIYTNHERVSILQQKEPLTPHWVAYWGDKKLLFSSKLTFDGSNPKPYLLLYKSDKEIINIWTEKFDD